MAITPGGTCMDIFQCSTSACSNYDQACIQKCLTLGSSNSQSVFMALAQCVVGACGLPPVAGCVDKAIGSTCVQQYAACKQDGLLF